MRTVLRRPAESPHSSSTRYSRRCTSIWEGGAGGGSGGGEREEGIHVSRERRCPRARGRRVGAECARGRKDIPVDCRRLGRGLTYSAHCRSSCRQRGGTSQQPPSRPGPAPHCAAAGLAKAPWEPLKEKVFSSLRTPPVTLLRTPQRSTSELSLAYCEARHKRWGVTLVSPWRCCWPYYHCALPPPPRRALVGPPSSSTRAGHSTEGAASTPPRHPTAPCRRLTTASGGP